jgi:hypothetical protein
MPAPSMPIQVVQVGETAVQMEQHQLNGDTTHKEDSEPATPTSCDKPQQPVVAAITSSPYSDGSSQTLPDDDGNV